MLAVAGASNEAPGPSDPTPVSREVWGSERQFHPASLILNEGWDIAQLEDQERRLSVLHGAAGFRRLAHTLAHPLESIERVGWREFAATELVPTSLDPGRAQWIPNYQAHLLGGGFLNWKMEDWFRSRGCEAPRAAAFAVSATSWILNEAAELAPAASTDHETDPVADVYVFDLAGVLVFQSAAVRRLFTERVEMMNWPLQPSFDPRSGKVWNAGQYHALKFPVPGSEAWKIFYHFGLGNIGGLTRRLGNGVSLSAAAGVHARQTVPAEGTRRTVELAPKMGIFLDRGNSLLASVFLNGQSAQRLVVQVHPTPWTSWPVPWGAWVGGGGSAGYAVGVAGTWGLGVALGR